MNRPYPAFCLQTQHTPQKISSIHNKQLLLSEGRGDQPFLQQMPLLPRLAAVPLSARAS
jgi:hypothetical protein